MKKEVLLFLILFFIFPMGVFAAPKDEGYIYTENRYFYQNGKKLPIIGATFYPYFQINGTGSVYRGSGWLKSEFPSYIQTIVDQAAANGMTTLRATNQMSANTDPYDATLWSNMDYFMTYTASKGMYVILDLSTFRNKLRDQGIMPYDSTKWKDFITFVVNRYHTRKNILYISIAGEVEAPTGSDPYRTTTANLTKFYDEVSTQIYTLDGGAHQIQAGGFLFLNFNSGIDWQSIFSLPHIGQASIHVYSDGDRTVTIPTVTTWAKLKNIPLMIDEFGFKQSLGDTQRASSYNNTFNLVKQYEIAGSIVWNQGPEIKSDGDTYDVSPATPLSWQAIKNFSQTLGTSTTQPTVRPVPKVADGNHDGFIDGADFVIWLNHYNTTGADGAVIGDYNNSGKVDGADFVVWLNNYGK